MGPIRSFHGAHPATFERIVEAEVDGDVTVDITGHIMNEGRPNTDHERLPEELFGVARS